MWRNSLCPHLMVWDEIQDPGYRKEWARLISTKMRKDSHAGNSQCWLRIRLNCTILDSAIGLRWQGWNVHLHSSLGGESALVRSPQEVVGCGSLDDTSFDDDCSECPHNLRQCHWCVLARIQHLFAWQFVWGVYADPSTKGSHRLSYGSYIYGKSWRRQILIMVNFHFGLLNWEDDEELHCELSWLLILVKSLTLTRVNLHFWKTTKL